MREEEDLDGFFSEDFMCQPCDAEMDKGNDVPAKDHQPNVHEGPTESHDAKIKHSPTLPTEDMIARHDATHLPYRNWCPICVKAKAKEDGHARDKGGLDEETGLPVVSMDYEMLEEKITTLIVKDNESGSVLAYDCEVKGPGDEWVLRQLARDLEDWGRSDICLKTDGEPAMLAVQKAVAVLRKARTIPRNPPAYNPQSNGAAEKAVQDVTGHARCLLLALEAHLKANVDVTLPIVKWLLRHAAFLLTRYGVGHDGMTAWRRLTGRSWNGLVVEIGEKVFGKLALKRSPTRKKHKHGKRKLAARSVEGTYLGIYPRTGEHIIARLDTGEAIRVRTVNRVPEEKRWCKDDIVGVKALPRRPNPNLQKSEQDIKGKLATDDAGKVQREGGADLGRPVNADAHKGARELRIDNRLLEKFGYTPECHGCIHKQLGLEGHRGHTAVCRSRIYEAMQGDADELDRLTRNENRLGRDALQDERIRRPVAPDAAVPQPAPATPAPSAAAPEEPAAPAQSAAADRPAPSRRSASHGGDVSNRVNEPNAQEEVEDAELPENSADVDADDDIPLGFEPDSDDEQDELQPSQEKRQRLASLVAQAARLNSLNELLQKPDVKKILEDLEKLPEFKLPKNRRQRRSMQGYGKDVAEIYSPPRVTKIASDMGLRPAWALDLTQVDPADGLPWDFSSKVKRRRARELLEADKPLMLIACPMCGHFSTLMNWNYASMSQEKAEEMLKAAMQHLKFALELCLVQYRAGRLFLFEHPAGASSWTTQMIQEMLRLEGVFQSKFDFCQLGMKTVDADGNAAAARKRTTVMTNSKNIAEVLRMAQCMGTHAHEPLLDGKAGPCQEYPKKFVELVCCGIRKEIDDIRWRHRVAKELDITGTVSALMEITEKLHEERSAVRLPQSESHPVPPHEEDDHARYEELYRDCDFYDDISGAKLDKKLATEARRTEIEFFKARGVYTKRRRESWMKVITTRWLDQNKGDEDRPKYRARLVGREIARDRRDDLFAATPPLESLKAIMSLCAGRQARRHAHRMMSIDVKRAYFYAPATRPIFIAIPKEDW